MLVTYTYQTEDAGASEKKGKGPSEGGEKSFSFWTALTFGNVVARPAGLGPRQSVAGLRAAATVAGSFGPSLAPIAS